MAAVFADTLRGSNERDEVENRGYPLPRSDDEGWQRSEVNRGRYPTVKR
jgi:hypothetical protein